MKIYNLFKVLKVNDSVPDDAVNRRYLLDTLVISGSPKTVLDKLVAFVDEMGGPFGGLLSTMKDWDEPEIHKTSMRLLAKEVMPRLREYCSKKVVAA